MGDLNLKPKIEIEVNIGSIGAIVVGNKTPHAQALREMLTSKGLNLDEAYDFDYLFQLEDLGNIETFLEKAKAKKVKYLLILSDPESKTSKNAEKKVLEYIKNFKIDGKVIKIFGSKGHEIEDVNKILKITFGNTPENVIELKNPQTIFNEETRNPNKRPLGLVKGTLIFICLILLIPLFTLSNVLLGSMSLYFAKGDILKSNFSQAKKNAQMAQNYFSLAQVGFTVLSPTFSFIGQDDKAQLVDNWLGVGKDLSQVMGDLVEVGQDGKTLGEELLNKNQGDLNNLLKKTESDSELAQRELSLVILNVPSKPKILADKLADLKTIRKALVSMGNLLPNSSWLLGLDGKRTYLVLFQNNFELRPGGGFIGTIGLLTVENGKMELEVQDVYMADGQLKGHVEPPIPLKEYLNQIHWYLRDSNWSPDIPQDAQKASWFLEKELGISPDGVIIIDLSLAKSLLNLTGPIDLPDYQEKISSDNLFLKAQTFANSDFFPGSTQKKDFFGALSNSIFDKITNSNDFSWLGFIKVLEQASQEKHFMVYVNNNLIQQSIEEMDWGGGLLNVTCPSEKENCLKDYLMIVDANLGVNKANLFVKKKISKDVQIRENSIINKITINYSNESPTNTNYGGVYKNYLRVLTPANFNLQSVLINNQPLSTNDTDKDMILDKQSTGFLLSVDPGTTKIVELTYEMPTEGRESDYELLIQKQAGTDNDPLAVSIKGIDNNEIFSYNGDLLIDRTFSIMIRK